MDSSSTTAATAKKQKQKARPKAKAKATAKAPERTPLPTSPATSPVKRKPQQPVKKATPKPTKKATPKPAKSKLVTPQLKTPTSICAASTSTITISSTSSQKHSTTSPSSSSKPPHPSPPLFIITPPSPTSPSEATSSHSIDAIMGRSEQTQPAGLQHPQPQQPPSPINSQFSQHQRVHSPLPLSLPSMTPPARAGSSSSSQTHSRHVSVSRGASQPPNSANPLAAPTGMALPSPSLPPSHTTKQQSHQQQHHSQQPKRSSSPERPPVSPITPPMAHAKPESTFGAKGAGKAQSGTNPLPPAATAPATTPTQTQLPPRATLTHNHQEDMAASAITMPPPLPLDFETNPDSIALQNAIAILQMQKRRAEADMIALQRAKNEALANPEAFLRDLQSGAVQMAGGIMPGEKRDTGEMIPSYSDSDSDSSSDSDVEMVSANNADSTATLGTAAAAANDNGGEGSSAQSLAAARAGKKKAKAPKPSWAKLPGEQNIVRCPPINWAQYAVVGESLDKLHAEQVKRPNGGVPAFFTPGGTYEFRAGGGVGSPAVAAAAGPGMPYLGVAAPYIPGRDVLPDKRRTGSVATGTGAGTGGRKNAKGPGRPARR